MNEHIQLMDLFTNSDEIDVFLSETVNQIIMFKWKHFAFKFHMIGLCVHFYFMTVLFVYVKIVYLKRHDSQSESSFGQH
jgi:hypothetical protein